jgi:hypothetical protein
MLCVYHSLIAVGAACTCKWNDMVTTSACHVIAGNICVYCPGGPDSDFEYSTQSYTGYEPTSMRAIRARYNPYVQVSTSAPRPFGVGLSLHSRPSEMLVVL